MSYAAVVLDKESTEILHSAFFSFIPFDWDVLCHHMTIKFGADSHPREGEEVTLAVTHWGKRDKVMAVRISGELSENAVPHITVAVDRKNGGKPVQSNDIWDWRQLEGFSTLRGKVQICK